MEIRYDPEADAMYIKFREGKYEISEEIRAGIIIDFENKINYRHRLTQINTDFRRLTIKVYSIKI